MVRRRARVRTAQEIEATIVSAARRKGNALELQVASRLRAIDGRDERLAPIESVGGRLGPAYAMQIDVATERFAVECKNREDNPARLWGWLDGLTAAVTRRGLDKVPVLVIKRNRHRPLVVITLDDFERLVIESRGRRHPGVFE
jgi:hypothetical protein